MKNKTKKILPLELVLITFIFLIQINNETSANEIAYPWRATSVIVENGGTFQILYNNASFQKIDSIKLTSEYFNTNLYIDSIEVGKFEYDHYTNKTVNQKIRVNVPISIPTALYDLFIFCGNEVNVSPKSVKIISETKEMFKFVHISDLHFTRNWIGSPEHGYAKELELFSSFVEVVNTIAPDFIIVTGDNIMDYTMIDFDSTGWGGERIFDAKARPLVEEKYKNFFWGAGGFEGIYGLNSPTFLIPGNHDFYGISKEDYRDKCEQWNDLMGKRYYDFLYSNTCFILTDDCLGDPINEIPEHASMSGAQGKIHQKFLNENTNCNIKIMAQHRHDNIDTTFLERNKINILLNGHNHSPSVKMIGKTPTHIIRSGTVCRSGEIKNWENNLGFFRIFYIDEINKSFSYTEPLRFCTNPTVNWENYDLNLKVEYKNPNNGTFSENKVIIENKFPVQLPNCKIRFIMSKGLYKISHGIISEKYDTDEFTIIDVNFDIAPKELVHIFIKPD